MCDLFSGIDIGQTVERDCPVCLTRLRIHRQDKEQCDWSVSLQTANEDLRASTEQHVMDDEIIVGLRAKLAEAEAREDAIRSAFYQEVTKRCTERALGTDFPKCAACDEPIIDNVAWHSNCTETIVQERDEAQATIEKMKMIYADQPTKAIGGYGQLLNVAEFSRWIERLGDVINGAALTTPSKEPPKTDFWLAQMAKGIRLKAGDA